LSERYCSARPRCTTRPAPGWDAPRAIDLEEKRRPAPRSPRRRGYPTRPCRPDGRLPTC